MAQSENASNESSLWDITGDAFSVTSLKSGILTESRRNKLWGTVILITSLTVVPLAAVFGILKYQDWQAIQRRPKTEPAIGPDNPPGPASFTPGREVREQPAITNIKIVTARQAGTRVEDDELVIGVVIDGKARAYPINTMIGYKREVFNDSLAGRPIAATW